MSSAFAEKGVKFSESQFPPLVLNEISVEALPKKVKSYRSVQNYCSYSLSSTMCPLFFSKQ